MAVRKIRVLVVDDSLLMREVIAKGLAADGALEVVGTAADPFAARDKIIDLEPDVMTLDVEMPRMSGIEFLKKLMPQYPLPVVVVSAVKSNVFDALNAGAVDFVTKPEAGKIDGMAAFINELIIKIKIASTAKVGHLVKKELPQERRLGGKTGVLDQKVIAIGASTGGTEAIYSVVKAFSREMPGIVIVQHMPPVFTKMYAERLNNSCQMEVREAQDGDLVVPGRVLIAAGDYHMKLLSDKNHYYVKCFSGERVNGHCPSVDVLFDSVAETAGKNAIGIILTGMGHDGAKGMLQMRKRGAYTIGQDEKTSVVYGMPMVAYNIGGVVKQAPLERIPEIVWDVLD